MSLSVTQKQLTDFLLRIGKGWHAGQVSSEVYRYIPYMESYPEVVYQYIDRFLPYFTDSPMDNHAGALRSLIQIAKAVPSVRDRIREIYGAILYEYKPHWYKLGSSSDEYMYYDGLTKILNIPPSPKDGLLQNISRSVVTLHEPLLVIIGAGFSYDSMPITNELAPLLTSFLHKAGISDPIDLIRKDNRKVWELVKKDAMTFKYMFAGRCSASNPASQHKIIAKMLHDGQISHIISFNWDNMIEKAYAELYNTCIPKVVQDGITPSQASLWKLHGDVDSLSEDWIWPYDEGRIFGTLKSSLDAMKKTNAPKYAMIVGYGEQEKNITDGLILPLSKSIPNIIRIRPNYDEQDDKGLAENARTSFNRLSIYSEIEAKKGQGT